jgi:hypothetical protein
MAKRAKLLRDNGRAWEFPPWLTLQLQPYLARRHAFAAVFCGTSLIRGCRLHHLVVRRGELPPALLYAQPLQSLRLGVPLAFELDLGRLPHLQRLRLGPTALGYSECRYHPALRKAHIYPQHGLAGLPHTLARLTVGGQQRRLPLQTGELHKLFPHLAELELDFTLLDFYCQPLPHSLRELRLTMDAADFFEERTAELAWAVAWHIPRHVVIKVDIGGGFDQLVLAARERQRPSPAVDVDVRRWIQEEREDLEFHDPTDAELYAGFL